MKKLLAPLLLLLAFAASGQTIIEIKPDVHPRLDSVIKAAPVSDATKMRALAVANKTAGHTAFNLRDDYGLTAADGMRQVRAVMSLDSAKRRFPEAWRGMNEERKADGALRFTTTQAQNRLLDMSMFDAAHTDATWYNSPYIPLAGSRGLLLSNNKITIPLGGWWATVQVDVCYNITEGEGNFNANDQSGLGGTEIHAWLDKWQDDKDTILLMGAFHGGSNNFYAYSEGQQVRDLRLNGHADSLRRPGRVIIGFQAWDAGSGSNYRNLFIHHCDECLDAVRGTPFTADGSIGLFSCTTCAFCITGGSGGSHNVETLELDDNSCGILSRAGWGRPAGCDLTVDLVKMEQLVTPARFYAPNRLKFEGWTRAQFDVISTAAAWGYLGDLIDLNANINTSHLMIDDLRGFGNRLYQNVIYDRLNKEQLPFDNGYTSRIINIDWYSDMGGTVYVRPNTQATMEPTVRGPGLLGYLKSDPVTGQPMGTFDLEATKPSWTDEGGNGGGTGPAPVTCTGWTTGAWGTCTAAGKQTRTVTATPAGCTGTPSTTKPKDTRNCTPPPTPPAKWSSCTVAPCSVSNVPTTNDPMPGSSNPVNELVITDAQFQNVSFGWINDRMTVHNGNLYVNPSGGAWNVVLQADGSPLVVTANTIIPELRVPLPGYSLTYAIGNVSQSVAMTASKWEYR